VPVTQEERTALALAALGEVTDPSDVGELVAVEEPEAGVVDLRFACTLSAYTGWSWVVSTSDLPDHPATVLEVELLPGDGALLAPPWVPWTERLAEWRRQHPDEVHPDDEADDLDPDEDHDDEEGDLDEDDLAVDDELDGLDEAELEGTESPEESEQDTGDVSDEDDAVEADPPAEAAAVTDEGDVKDDGDPRPADEDRGP
jgi:hypothetical protein